MEDIFDESMITRHLGGGGEGSFGVHITYDELWYAMIYLALIYTLGYLGQRFLAMPELVGQIFAGIIFGPELVDKVPFPAAFVLLGEIGLVLLVVEAGVDIDVTTLKLIGPRGVVIAILGSILPIVIGLAVAFAVGAETKAAIAAGASFGPTSLGIAMNILKTAKIINTPTGQLIVAAAIIDDMIALIILSQLTALTGDITVASVLIPVVSALAFLIIGGYLALFIIPDLLEKYILKESMSDKKHGKIALLIMWGLVLGLMPATHFAKASHLMGAFIAGLVFCTDHELHVEFVSQFKRTLQWLMRIFFASTIGFQVPIKKFGNITVIWQGLLFTTALIGKLAVGFMVPNFSQTSRFKGHHLRDCLIVGCSMAAEGEFAFVIAAYSVDNGIIDVDLYSSVVLAILLSTILAPFSLRYTISYFNKKSMQELEEAEQEVRDAGDADEQLKAGLIDGSTVFYCINTTSHASWGTLPKLMQRLFELQLVIIDHRSWHSRFEDTVINEIYVRSKVKGDVDIDELLKQVEVDIKDAIDQPDSVVTVTRWLPGVVDELNGEDSGKVETSKISDRLFKEVQSQLDRSEHKSKTTDDLRATKLPTPPTTAAGAGTTTADLFRPAAPIRPRRRQKTMSTPLAGDMWKDTSTVVLAPGEVLVNVTGPNGEKFVSKMKATTLANIRTGAPVTLTELERSTTFEGEYLDGFVRRGGRQRTLSNLSFGTNENKAVPEDDVV